VSLILLAIVAVNFIVLADCARILCKLKKNETYDNSFFIIFKVIQYFKTREILAGKKD
jgi:hypothetical protein